MQDYSANSTGFLQKNTTPTNSGMGDIYEKTSMKKYTIAGLHAIIRFREILL